ncbi:GIY-YIG nuclease family protein [Natronospira bacteriovora]|uniref:GIY-YIG nuclease family protein n=1 Tax=Natronospira bacteriovora TaxID=3069753 RepID=A0ABU0W4H9_9GAMM|nr:GIY-YIG nuclease family protein [Natronospira sp. AB-CW4]MDQ2068886.1 GIY-YIG nuclease family protein [Natronospira sp. AB-CW4]
MEPSRQSVWWLYLLDCDGRLYTGVTTDVDRRLSEHRQGQSRGARFTRGAGRIELVYQIALNDRSEALRAEARLRRLRRPEKLAVVEADLGRVALLARLGLG